VAIVARSGILERRLPVAFVPFETTLNQDMKALVPKDGIDARWVAWGLRVLERKILSECRKAGTTVASLDTKRLHAIKLPIPPLTEQRQIVDILEDHLSRLDAASAYLATSAQKSDVLHGAVLQAAVRGDLTTDTIGGHTRSQQLMRRAAMYPAGTKRGRPEPVPAASAGGSWPPHWVRVSLEEATHPVRTISYGILKPGPNMDGGVPYVRVVNMRNDVLALGDLRRTTQDIATQYDRSTLIPGDVLVSIRGTYGRVVLVPEALRGGNITQDTARLAFVGPVDPTFATIYLRSPWAQHFLKRVARGVAVKGVNIADLRAMPFPIPPVAEQLAITKRVAELTSDIDGALRAVRSTVARSLALRRALLDAAFSGRLTGRASDMDRVEEMAGV
jgi:type I restriction enzyme S subunit